LAEPVSPRLQRPWGPTCRLGQCSMLVMLRPGCSVSLA